MLVLPKPEGFSDEAWKVAEYQAMTEVVGLYGKTWHFWEIDADHDIPLGLWSLHEEFHGRFAYGHTGYPKLMGSLTNANQLNLDEALADRNKKFNVDHKVKAELRKEIVTPGVAASMLISSS